MANNSKPGSEREGISRRQWLEMAAGSTAGLVAGCTGQPDTETQTQTETESPTGGEGEQETQETDTGTPTPVPEMDTTMRMMSYTSTVFSDWNMNPFATNATMGGWKLFCIFANFSQNQDDWYKIDLDKIEGDRENHELRLTIKDNIQWHKNGKSIGKEVTAEDAVLGEELNFRMVPKDARTPLEERVDTGWHAEGKNNKTFVVELNDQGANIEKVKGWYLQRYQIFHYRDGPFKPKLEGLRDATTTKERNSIRDEVTKMSIPPSKKLMSGPWLLKDLSNQRLLFEMNPDHWNADKINFSKFRFIYGGGEFDKKTQQAFANDKVDVQRGPHLSQAEPPDKVTEVRHPTNQPRGLTISYGDSVDPIYRKENLPEASWIRQAYAYALKNETIMKNGSPPATWGRPSLHRSVKRQHGLPQSMAKDLYPDLFDKLPTYNRDLDKAGQLLKKAGLSKQKDGWVKPNGKPLKLKLQAFPWTLPETQTVSSQLETLGVDVELSKASASQLANAFWGNKDYTALFMQTSPKFGPPSNYVARFLDPRNTNMGKNANSANHPPKKWKVPPIGEFEAEPTKTINTFEMFKNDRFERTPESQLKDEIKKLVWIHAYHLPTYDVYYWGQASRYNTRYFDWPELPDPPAGVCTRDMPRTYSHDVVNYNLRGIVDPVTDQWAKAIKPN